MRLRGFVMSSEFFSLSSGRLPQGLSLSITHGFDFEVPYSQAHYNFLNYSFKHNNEFEVGTKVYLDELSMPAEIRSVISVSPYFEPYNRADLPDDYIASVLKTLAALGYSAIFEDYESDAIKLEALYKNDELETVMQDWIKLMDETRK